MPPVTLTRAQFNAHPVSRKPGSTYETYVRFVNRRRASAPAAPVDPLTPTPEPVLRQQTTEAVRAQIDPILREIMADTNRAASGIELSTATHAKRLEPYAGMARERFGRAAESTAGVATALADRLAGKGAEAGAGLREKLAAINAPDRLTQEVAGGTERFGTGAANAGFGIDSAALEEIISRGAGAEDFAGSLPGIANIAGVRSIGDVRAAGQRSVADVRGKVPGLIAELMESGRDREVNKGIAKLGLQESREQTTAKMAADQAAAQADAVKEADRSAQAWARIQQAGERLQLQGSTASFNQAVTAAKLGLSEKSYKLALQREARLAKGTGKGGFTPAQKQDMAGWAFGTAEDDFRGGVYVKEKFSHYDSNAAVPPVETLRDLLAAGVPFSIAVKAIQRFAKSGEPAHLKGVTALDEHGREVSLWSLWKATLGWTETK